MKTTTRFFTLLTLLALTFGAAGITPAYAATITVTNANDSGAGSLRQAIADAAAGDTITFAGDYTILLASQLTIDKNLTIDGVGHSVTVSGNHITRVFNVTAGQVTFNRLTIADGNAQTPDCGIDEMKCGGGIALQKNNAIVVTVSNSTFTGNSAADFSGGIHVEAGTLNVTDSTFSGNSAPWGGVIYNYGTLTVTNSTFSGNSASFNGGGIQNGGTLTVMNSTFSGNSATLYGGAIITGGGTATVTNSTFSGNSAAYGGGLYNYYSALSGTMTVTNSTFSGNSATSDGGGIFNAGGTVTVKNTLIVKGAAGANCYGTIDGANNLADDGTCGAGFTNSPTILLGALGNYGGSTQTIPILAGSSAIDAGDDTVCAAAPVNGLDQRGVTRPQGAHCDIGAYEEATPTLTFKSAGVQDGWILESAEKSNKGGTLDAKATTFRLGDDAAKKQHLGILSFSTGAGLPDDAVITKVTLKIKKQGVTGGGNPLTTFKGFMVDVKKGTFGTAALQASDFQAAASKTYGPFKPALAGGWYSMDLTSASTYINKLSTLSGLTQIRLRFKLDDNNNAVANYLSLFSGNAPVGSRPQLIIEYYVP
jgi:predicted outer membrane repeat protein